jgi:hypothetical protein
MILSEELPKKLQDGQIFFVPHTGGNMVYWKRTKEGAFL